MIKQLPNILSISRIIWAFVFYALIMSRPLVSVALLFLLFVFIESSDFLDGVVARVLKSTSDVGKLLDPVCDVTAHFVCMFALYTLYMVPPLVIVVFIVREIWVTFLRAVLMRKNTVLAAGWAGKLKTWVYAVAIMLSIVLLPQSPVVQHMPGLSTRVLSYVPLVYYAGAALSILSALGYVAAALRSRMFN